MLSTSPQSSKSSQRFLRISAIHHNMTHFISESTVHEYQYSIEHFPETSSLMTSDYGTNYDFSICSRSPHSSLSLKELQTSFPDVAEDHLGFLRYGNGGNWEMFHGEGQSSSDAGAPLFLGNIGSLLSNTSYTEFGSSGQGPGELDLPYINFF